jgi:hypothetical protein
MGGSDRQDEQRWRPRPMLSFGIRFVSVLVPAVAGAASAYGFVVALPVPDGVALTPWAVGLVVSSTIATALAERIGKRFLPLAMLLRLSLVFPDRGARSVRDGTWCRQRPRLGTADPRSS